MEKLIKYIKSKINIMEFLIADGLIPGQLDSIDIIEMGGAIKELKHILTMIEKIKQAEIKDE